jgi:hypothetical protein
MEKHDLLHVEAADLAALLLVRPNHAVAEKSIDLAGYTLYADGIITVGQ